MNKASGYEGTIELKHDKRLKPDLKSLLRGNQKSALIEYYHAGGRKRFALCYCNGRVYLWDTRQFYRAILGKDTPFSSCLWEDTTVNWLESNLKDAL